MAKVTVTGREGVQDALERHLATVEAELEPVVAESAQALAEGIRQRLPYDTGALYHGVEIHYAPDGLSAEIGFFDPDLYYIDFVENGTSTQPAQPALRPAAAEEERELPGRVAHAVQGSLP